MLFENRSFRQVHVLGRKEKWSLGWDAYFLIETLKKLNVGYSESRLAFQQIVYLQSKFAAPRSQYHRLGNKVLFDYFHGDPSFSPDLEPLLNQIIKKRAKFSCVRVSHSAMEEMLLNRGLEGKVFRIPLGVHLPWFSVQTAESKSAVRQKLGIPQSAVVIGSFQKDGIGWGAGQDPKLIKGPDILLRTLSILRETVPDLFVLLTGPARGFVKIGLEKLAIPYLHVSPQYPDIGKYYQALDVYLVTSREEGGPKAILESMASGVPLVTTRVGQAIDLVEHQSNGWLAQIEDPEALAHWALFVIQNKSQISENLVRARQTANSNSHDALAPVWERFLARFLHSQSDI